MNRPEPRSACRAPFATITRPRLITVSGQPVTARLVVSRFADPLVEFIVRGNVDLAAVAPMFAPAGTQLAGRAAVNLSGRGRAKDPGAMAISGTADLSDVSVEGAGLPKKVEQVSGRVEFSPARAAIHQLSAHAGQSSYTLDATVERPLALMAAPGKAAPADVEFSFRSPYLVVRCSPPPRVASIAPPRRRRRSEASPANLARTSRFSPR